MSKTLPAVESVVLQVVPPYHLIRTLSCGQAFRWRHDSERATGIFAGRVIQLHQRADGIAVQGLADPADLLRLRRYLGLDEPLAAIERALREDRVLRTVLPSTTGLALLRQDPWECLISFIVSAFNNIPKIELSLDRLCRRLGDPVGNAAWRFPDAERLARAPLATLRACALGYRVPYVRSTARRIVSGEVNLEAVNDLPYEEARRILLALPGVGEKVADCVLLFAYGQAEAFPVDVWVRRAVERWYLRGRRMTDRRVREFARRRFGPLAGYAQQHLYFYIRERGTGNGERRRIRR